MQRCRKARRGVGGCGTGGAGDILLFLTGQAEVDRAVAKINETVAAMPSGSCGDLLALPLYAALPPELQVPRPLSPSPGGKRIRHNFYKVLSGGVAMLSSKLPRLRWEAAGVARAWLARPACGRPWVYTSGCAGGLSSERCFPALFCDSRHVAWDTETIYIALATSRPV